jgi:hypothetical protein
LASVRLWIILFGLSTANNTLLLISVEGVKKVRFSPL